MPDPLVVVAMREFKAGLLAREDAQMFEMAQQWLTVERSLTELIENLANDFEKRKLDGETISAAAFYKMDRYKRLRSQARDETAQYAQWADGSLTQYQDTSVDLGLDHSRQAIQLSYSPSVGAFFDRLPKEAVQNIVGIAGNGRPLGELLKNRMVTNDQDVWQRLVDNLVRGTALGYNPRKVARQMRDDLAGGLNKALVIARTEGLRPYREASRAQYESSGVVTGQKRLCAHDGRVCGACLADEGTLYDLSEVISDHPQGRCTPVPVVRGMPETTWTAGEDWFKTQPESVQESILGPGRLQAYNEGLFNFGNLVRRTNDKTWGKGLNPRSLADLLKGGRDRGAPAVDLRGPTKGPRPTSPTEDDLAGQIESMRPIMEAVIAEGDPTGAGLKSVLDTLEQQLDQEKRLNQELWNRFGVTPDQATNLEWQMLADQLKTEGMELYEKYTKEGIRSGVAQERGAQLGGYMVVGKEQIQVRQGAFSAAAAQRMQGEIWKEAKDELREAQGDLLKRIGFTEQEIARASYEQRLRLLEEMGRKELLRTGKGRVSTIDAVDPEVRERRVAAIDFDLAAIAADSAIDPLALPTLDAYSKLELSDLIRATRITEEEGF